MSARDETRGQIFRIVDLGDNDEPLLGIRCGQAPIILGHNGVPAVRDAVLAQVSGAQVGGHNFEAAGSRLAARTLALL